MIDNSTATFQLEGVEGGENMCTSEGGDGIEW